MEGQVDSHQWGSKMEKQRRLSGKPDLQLDKEPDTQTGEAVSVQRIFSRKAGSRHGDSSAESMAVRRFTRQLLSDLRRFKA